ncbi:MAG: ribosome-associated translation inhibitor RaiA [Alphaproteobacteria bacterium]|nr:MAG: ribosome-associated translation inhibitor RaiA [Alphaproteobacteria bacterium]
MDIKVSGRHIDVGDALRAHMQQRIEAGAAKYFDRSISAQITLSKAGHGFHADCTLRAPRGVTLQSHGEGGDAYSAFDAAADKIEKQLRRYKRRLTNHHQNSEQAERMLEQAQAYVLAAASDGEEAATPHNDHPIIIAETTTDIPCVSVSDAVMLMDLANATAFLFRNIRNDQLNVVYRRPDGNIGWLDPAPRRAD